MVILTPTECPECGAKAVYWDKCEECGTVFEIDKMNCPHCEQPLDDLLSEAGMQYRGCKPCQAVWIGSRDSLGRRMYDHEVLQKVDDVYYLRE